MFFNEVNREISNRNKKILIITGIILGIYLIIYFMNIFTNDTIKMYNLKSTIVFIRFFNSMLSILAIATCLISYIRVKNDDIFVLTLMYISLSLGIILGQVDFLSFYQDKYNLSNYLNLSTSVLGITLLLISLLPNNILKKYIVKNKSKAVVFVIVFTIIMGIVERKLAFNEIGFDSDFFMLYNGFLAIVYIYSGIILFKTGKVKNEYIYIVFSLSIFTLAIKSIYAIYVVDNISFYIKLVSVSITYLMFLIIICGAFIELYTSIDKTKRLNQNLNVFYNFAENNKHTFMLICNEKGKIVYANKKLKDCYLNGYGDDYLNELNNAFSNNMFIINKKDHENIYKKVMKNGQWSGIIKDKDGKQFIDCSIQLINIEDNHKTIAVTYTDISNEIGKEVEFAKLKAYTKERTEFMSNISHELRTPVNIFYSTIQLLDKFMTTDDIEFKSIYNRYKKTLHVNCKRMLRLINNVVDISKIETGILKGEFDNFNIVSLIEDVTLSVVNYSNLKNINIQFDTNVEENIIKCDANMIERVMLNLLSNAIKFSHQNSQIYVDVLVNDDWTEIDIKDEGIGISKEDKKAIFERFVQADKSLTRENEGSGIGLSIVKSIVDLHDGYISVESEINRGSTFKILLPNKLEEYKEYKSYNIDDYNTELELSDIYEVLVNII